MVYLEYMIEIFAIQTGHNTLILLEQRLEFNPLLPGFHGISLYDGIGRLPGHPLLNQFQQHHL